MKSRRPYFYGSSVGIKKSWWWLILGLLSVSSLQAQRLASQPLGRYTFSRGLFGTQFRVILYASSDSLAETARRAVDARMDSLNYILSDYLDDSEINRLSSTAGSGRWVAVSPDLFAVLQRSIAIARASDGLFDPTVGRLSLLWRRAVRRKEFPGRGEIRRARRTVGYRAVELDSSRRAVRLHRSGTRLDVGGIGQGYAIDEGMKVLRQYGIRSALLDMGGDILVSDPPPGEQGWRIRIGSDTTTVWLRQVAVTTSGAEFRYLEHRGRRYSHLMNPRTGLGLRRHVRTTVLAPDGVRADALTKVFSVAGIRKSRRLIKRFEGVAVRVEEIRNGRVKSWSSPHYRTIVLSTPLLITPLSPE